MTLYELRPKFGAGSSWLIIMPAVAFLALAISSALRVLPQPYDGLSWSPTSRQVLSIETGGPGAQAGLAVGDVIVAIDDVPINQSPPFYSGHRVGDTVSFDVRRGSAVLHSHLVLGSPSPFVLLERLEPLLIALLVSLIGVVTLLTHPADLAARLFFLLSQIGSAVLAAGLLSTLGLDLSTRLFSVLLCWLSPLAVHFHSVFPAALPRRRQLPLLGLCYVIAVALSLPYVFLSIAGLKTIPAYLYLYQAVRIYPAAAILVAIFLLIHNYVHIPLQAVRQRIRLVVFGTVVALLPLAMLSLLPEALEGRPLISYETSFAFLLITPLAYGYAIYKHNLWRADRVLNRSLVLLILSIGWVGFYFLLIDVLKWLLPGANAVGSLIGTLVIVAAAVGLPFLRDSVQGLVDRLFYGGWYDYRTVVSVFSRILSGILDEAAFCELMVERLPNLLRVRNAALLLPVREGGLAVRGSYSHDADAPSGRPAAGGGPAAGWPRVQGIPGDGALAQRMRQDPKLWQTRDLAQSLAGSRLAQEEAALLYGSDVQLWLPLAIEGDLEGLLLLGPKLADDLYNAEDYRILETLAWQATTAARNVHLVGELRRSLQEGAESKLELAEAHRRLLAGREEERGHLAREIHDGPVQSLIRLSYQLRDAERKSEPGSELFQVVGKLRAESLELLADLRRICTDLRPPVLDILGLGAAMQAHAVEAIEGGPLTTFEIREEDAALPDDVAISLFRIYQEALANALRHAGASEILVSLEITHDACLLAVRDNGRGFVVARKAEMLARDGHLGLLGMRERAEALGGTLELVSAPGNGTQVIVCVPRDGTPGGPSRAALEPFANRAKEQSHDPGGTGR